jgi:hypothetical protein
MIAPRKVGHGLIEDKFILFYPLPLPPGGELEKVSQKGAKPLPAEYDV